MGIDSLRLGIDSLRFRRESIPMGTYSRMYKFAATPGNSINTRNVTATTNIISHHNLSRQWTSPTGHQDSSYPIPPRESAQLSTPQSLGIWQLFAHYIFLYFSSSLTVLFSHLKMHTSLKLISSYSFHFLQICTLLTKHTKLMLIWTTSINLYCLGWEYFPEILPIKTPLMS